VQDGVEGGRQSAISASIASWLAGDETGGSFLAIEWASVTDSAIACAHRRWWRP
jgi:hypothetical protein